MEMDKVDIIGKLRSQSTWRLLGLGIITYGVYYAYYLRNQTPLINSYINDDSHISLEFVNFVLFISYLSLALLVPYLLIDESRVLSISSNLVDKLWVVLMIVWGFKARNRLNAVLLLKNDDDDWFHGFWTFLFSPLYFNYKVNVLNEKNAEQ